MPDPITVAVPQPVLHRLRNLAREGLAPRITWSISPTDNNHRAHLRREEIFTEILEHLDPHLPAD